MVNPKVPVYLMPGMAASPKIFEHITLPEDRFELHYLEWLMPLKNESIEAYALRLTKCVKHDNPVLLGVSFGGVLVQEMRKHMPVQKLIIVSSVKSNKELSKQMMIAKVTMAYKLVPTHLVNKLDMLSKYAFGDKVVKRLELYKKYLSVSDSHYLSWAIKQMLCWKQSTFSKDIVHINGDKDTVFPIQNIKNCIVIPGGTHIMIINKYKWFNKNLPSIILNHDKK